MTASEISAELVCEGRILHPKTPSQMGEILRKHGFVSIRKGHMKRTGYVVKRLSHNLLDHQHLAQSDEYDAQT